MASMSTSTSQEDPCTRWTQITDDEVTTDNVEQLLKPVHDDLWVAAACVDRIVEDQAVQRSLVELGIERTQSALERSRRAYERLGDDGDEEDTEVEDARTEEQKRHASLISYFQDESADAQLCRIRAIFLHRLDRLNTFVEVCKETLANEEDAEAGTDDEWEDDPWADQATTNSSEKSPSYAPRQSPTSLSVFLTANLLDISCLLASHEQFAAVRIVMTHHGTELWPYRFAILESVPEHAFASEFRNILPSYDHSTDLEQKKEPQPWRHDVDFSESAIVQTALSPSGVSLDTEPPSQVSMDVPPRPEPLTSDELATWYQGRIDLIMSSTGMADVALSLVQHAASQGVPQLDSIGEELSLLSRLIYDASPSDKDVETDWSITSWKSMEPPAVIHAYLAHSTPKTIAKDISRLVMPYLFVLESRAERAGHPNPSLPNDLLYDFILGAPLETVAAIFEASKPTLPPPQRVIRNDEDMACIALACLYGSDSLDEWPTMSRIFECLPAWGTPDDGDEADAADTTIASLGAFVAPSTSRPRCAPSDLMLFFKPLPSSSLSHALDVLDVHLESGEILARWSVPAPLRWLLRSNQDIVEQRSWANRMARRAGGSQDKLKSQEDWEWLLEDMLKLSESGESGSRSAFSLLSRDDIVRIFFSGLLSSSRFDIAKALLRSSAVHLSLDPQVIEDICMTCSQEFYENASSGNYHFGDMKLAYDCLDIPAPSERINKEKEFIEATSRLCSFNLMSRSGIPITPLEIRLTKDRLSLVSRVLSSNGDAYKHTQVILDLVEKLGFRGDAVAEIKTLAMLVETALQAEDFTRAYETGERMVETVLQLKSSMPSGLGDPRVDEASAVCWLTCFQLGRHPEFEDVEKKLALLGSALQLCPAENIHDILVVWRRLEREDMEERRERLAARHSDAPLTASARKRPNAHRNGPSLTDRLQYLRMPDLHMPHSPLLANAPDAAALANKAFNRVAANFPFPVGNRGRSFLPEDNSPKSGEGSRTRGDGSDVAARVLQKGIGWLLGADDD